MGAGRPRSVACAVVAVALIAALPPVADSKAEAPDLPRLRLASAAAGDQGQGRPLPLQRAPDAIGHRKPRSTARSASPP